MGRSGSLAAANNERLIALSRWPEVMLTCIVSLFSAGGIGYSSADSAIKLYLPFWYSTVISILLSLTKISRGCSGISLIASWIVLALTAKRMSASFSTKSMYVRSVISLSAAVSSKRFDLMSKTKQFRIGMVVFAAMTRPMDCRRADKTELEITNFIMNIYF